MWRKDCSRMLIRLSFFFFLITCSCEDVFAYDNPEDYKGTVSLTSADKVDLFQRNINAAIPKAESVFKSVSVSAEWTDQAQGKGEVHVYLDADAESVPESDPATGKALYITTNCNEHGLTPEIVLTNLEEP